MENNFGGASTLVLPQDPQTSKSKPDFMNENFYYIANNKPSKLLRFKNFFDIPGYFYDLLMSITLVTVVSAKKNKRHKHMCYIYIIIVTILVRIISFNFYF